MSRFHEKTYLAARGKWRGVLAQLGVPEGYLSRDRFGKPKSGPCPFCNAGEDRFTFDDKEGSGSFICRHCGAGMGLDFVMRFTGLAYGEAAARVDAILGNVKPDSGPAREEMTEEQARNISLALWRETKAAADGDALVRYLASRGIAECPANLRFHPKLRDGEGGIRPCMVAKIDGPDGAGVSLHRTFLRADGGAKAEMERPRKLMPGALPDGSCVRLGPVNAELGIAEGIETALSASALYGLPVWAGISAPNMVKWLPPEGVESVTIFGDADANFTGQCAAYTLAHRIKRHAAKIEREIDVVVKLPPALGWDWNDCLLAEQRRSA